MPAGKTHHLQVIRFLPQKYILLPSASASAIKWETHEWEATRLAALTAKFIFPHNVKLSLSLCGRFGRLR